MNPASLRLSQFISESFDVTRGVALLAGKGRYPELVFERLMAAGIPTSLVAFENETNVELFERFDPALRTEVNVGEIGKMLKALKRFDVGYAIMAGQITPGKLFGDLKLDLKAVLTMAKLKERNAETIFGAIAKEINDVGVELLDARSFLDDQLAEDDVMVGKLTIRQDFIQHGIRIAKVVAANDIGQGVVVRKGTVLAVEAFEGTDAMLRRAGSLKANESLFIKTVKRNQDYRFDVPVFGLQTIQVMIESGIENVGLEAGCVLMLDKKKVLDEAKRNDITIFGYTSNE